jgi:hypothetical protein
VTTSSSQLKFSPPGFFGEKKNPHSHCKTSHLVSGDTPLEYGRHVKRNRDPKTPMAFMIDCLCTGMLDHLLEQKLPGVLEHIFRTTVNVEHYLAPHG